MQALGSAAIFVPAKGRRATLRFPPALAPNPAPAPVHYQGKSTSMTMSGRRMETMIEYQSFTGGIFETNCYALEAPEGWILFDAPEGASDWLLRKGIDLRLLLLTHGHVDQ